MKKRLATLIAGLSVFAMTSASFAANTAVVSVTSEPIRQGATCDKAGGFALTFDTGTVFKGGDQITIDLDLGVTLCRDIDMEIGLENGVSAPHAGTIGTVANIAVAGITEANSPISGAGSLTAVNGGVLFKVSGTEGSSRVTLDVMSDFAGGAADGTLDSEATSTLTFAEINPGDKLKIAFLDQAVYPSNPGFPNLLIPNTDSKYVVNGTIKENTLCIDVSSSAFTASKVFANIDSKGDKYTWSPSNPQIAHVIQASALQFESCKGRVKGNIILPTAAGEQGPAATCVLIDNDLEATTSNADGFCFGADADEHYNNKVIIKTSDGTPFDSTDYQVQLDILVNGVEGNNGVYWANENVTTIGADTTADACDLDTADATTSIATSFYLSGGTTAADFTADTDSTDCTVADKAKAVRALTDESGLGLAPTNDFLYVNLPRMVIDSSEFTEGDVLSVKVTLIKAPCGELFSEAWEIGTAGCAPAAAASYALTFPYFAKTGAYANAIIVTNTSATAGTAEFTIYEMDGDVFTASAAVAANSMFVDLLGNLTMTPNAGNAGTFGDTKAYVKVTTDFDADGAAMITNPATGESIGYLPRQN